MGLSACRPPLTMFIWEPEGSGRTRRRYSDRAARPVRRGGLRNAQRDRQDGIGAEARFVRRAVQVDQDIVDLHLLGRVHAADRVVDFALHIGDGFAHALAAIA